MDGGGTNQMTGLAATRLADFHGSLSDSVLESMNFLNEIMSAHPHAISFAPGAPNLAFLDELRVDALIDRFLDYLCRRDGRDREQARRVLYEYGPSTGVINALIADALRRDWALAIDAESVVITVGAQEAMVLVVRALCANPDDALAVVCPSYVGVVGAARVLGISVVPIPEGNDGPDLAHLQAAIAGQRGGRIRALYVAPDFANPSGASMSLRARHALLSLADREDFVIIEDTAYGFTAPLGEAVPPLKALDRTGAVVLIGTFAKIGIPGARVGYLVADQRVVDDRNAFTRLARHLGSMKSMITVNTSPICQAIVAGLLLENDGSLAALGQRKAELYRRNLALLVDELDARFGRHPGIPDTVRWTRPSGGFFVRMQLPISVDRALLEYSAANFGVLWTPMAQFHMGTGGDQELRLSCSYLDAVGIQEGVARLADFLAAAIADRAPALCGGPATCLPTTV